MTEMTVKTGREDLLPLLETEFPKPGEVVVHWNDYAEAREEGVCMLNKAMRAKPSTTEQNR